MAGTEDSLWMVGEAGQELAESFWAYSPVFGVAATLIVYTAALRLQRWKRGLHPLFLTSGLLILLLFSLGIPYEAYRVGGDLIVFFLGPATVALGVPLYKYAKQIRGSFVSIICGITVGSVSGLAGAWVMLSLTGGSRELLLSALPKSVTAPIAVEIAGHMGGIPELAAVLTVLTGLTGSMLGPELLRLCGVRSDMAIGTAIGTGAHGIGTARLIRESELQGGVSSFAMGVNGIVTALLVIPLYGLLQG